MSPNDPKPARRRAPDDKRARILAAAERLFAERGYDKTPASAIAKEAGVSEGIVFHHFGSKVGLLAAVSCLFGESLNAVMFAGASLDEKPDVPGMITRCFDHVEAHGPMSQVLHGVGDPAVVSAAMEASRQAIVDALAEHFEGWHAHGYLRTEVPRVAASLMFGLVEYAMHDCFRAAEPGKPVSRARRDAYLNETVRVILSAMEVTDAEDVPA